jgi:branched-chain amino acid transport system substrate-binding protein
VRSIVAWHANAQPNGLEKFAAAYKERYHQDWYWLSSYLAVKMLAKAIDQAGAAHPLKVARALEGMKFAGPTGEVWMRAEDHQLMHPLYVARFTKAGKPGVKYDAENTGFGWATEVRLDAKDTVMPTTCNMQRP